ncbi:MAG: MATE family efflux transporter, partial [Oscillospiraceae bacterium]|nr:MATE family efflux transporter [Oscillospiraceae bacterium]
MREINLTEGPILKNLIIFSLPMIAGNLLQQVYNLVDTMVVGRFISSQALAAVGSSYTLMVFITSIIIGLCMGSGAIFSKNYGAAEFDEMQENIGYSFWFIAAVTAALYAVLYPGKMMILRVLQIPEELMQLTDAYVAVAFAGIGFIFLYNFFAYLLRARGNSFTPLIFLGIASVLNIILDLVFVLVFHMGVGGAALATVISQAVTGVGIAVYSFVKIPSLAKSLFTGKMNWQRLKAIIENDVATAIQQSVMNFGILMIQGLVNSFGACVMASFAAAVKIDTLAYMPAQEFGNAYSLFISQNHGAKKPERIRKGTRYAFVTSVVFCFAVSIMIWFFAKQLLGLFIAAEETQIIAEGIRYLHIEGAMYIGIGMLFLWYGYFRGIAKPYISLVLTIISLGTRVVLSYALAPHTPLGVLAIWCSIPIGWALADAAGLLLYKKSQRQ